MQKSKFSQKLNTYAKEAAIVDSPAEVVVLLAEEVPPWDVVTAEEELPEAFSAMIL